MVKMVIVLGKRRGGLPLTFRKEGKERKGEKVGVSYQSSTYNMHRRKEGLLVDYFNNI